ncbi:hypothetical protein HKX48_007795, partial [Thoreauomyces humboldtii]
TTLRGRTIMVQTLLKAETTRCPAVLQTIAGPDAMKRLIMLRDSGEVVPRSIY